MEQEDLWRAVEVNPDRALIETNKVCVCVCAHGQIAKKHPKRKAKSRSQQHFKPTERVFGKKASIFFVSFLG